MPFWCQNGPFPHWSNSAGPLPSQMQNFRGAIVEFQLSDWGGGHVNAQDDWSGVEPDAPGGIGEQTGLVPCILLLAVECSAGLEGRGM